MIHVCISPIGHIYSNLCAHKEPLVFSSATTPIRIGLIYLTCLLTFFGDLSAVAAKVAHLSGWVMPINDSARFKNALAHLSQFETIWLYGPSGEALLSQSETRWWDAPPAIRDLASLSMAKHIHVGPVLHNAGPKGFDPDLGVRLVKNPDLILTKIIKEMKVQGWKDLNIDLESLPETAAAEYEAFIRTATEKLGKLGMKVSVCLHAKTESVGTNPGARFQRWKELAKLKATFAIMAYDYTWSESEPGPIAPLSWIEKVSQFALTQFKRDQIIIALPLYGYRWKKSLTNSSWAGVPDIAPMLADQAGSTGWTKDSGLDLTNGHLFKKDANEVIAFDDSASVVSKMIRLKSKGISRFAVWRLGGDDASLYQALEKMP